eukprot:gene20733-22764_t
MRAQRTIHNTALRLNDPRILHLVQNHDLIAALYHVTCYKSFTRVRPDKPDKAEEKDEGKDDEDDEDDDYRIKEALSLDKLFHYIRNEVIAKEQVTTLVDLTLKLVQYLREAGLQQILDSTKKHLRRKLENEFGSAVTMFPNDSGRIIFLPLSVSATKLASEIVELKQELMQYRTDSGNSSRLVKNAALLLRSEAKSFQSPPAWPPLVSQLQGNNFPLPKNLNIFVTTLLDTNDAEENIFTPKTTSLGQDILCMKKIIDSQPDNATAGATIERTHQRSLSVETLELPVYNAGVRPEPPTLLPSANLGGEKSRKLAWLKNMIWVIARIANQQSQCISSWTGFNIQVRSIVTVAKDTVGYLPTIDAPATSMSTVYEVLCQAVRIKEALSLKSIVVIFDQAIYAKAVKIVWKHTNIFHSVVIRLGAFHTTCTLLAVIGKRFGDAGLRDICIESSVIAEGSVDGVLGGKQYNRAVRFHKLMSESCIRLIWEGFLSWIQACEEPTRDTLQSFLSDADNVWKDGLDIEMLQTLLESESLANIDALFQKYTDVLSCQNGTMSQFWMTYIDLVAILLNFIRASREGDWALHLTSIGETIPWCFAYDRTNYARYLPWYFRNMRSLSTTHSEVDEYFKAGGFSTQMSDRNTFGKIPMDQTIEETVNKDTQTPGGTKGFSLRKGCVARYYITADYRSSCVRGLREMVDLNRAGAMHPDLRLSRIRKDEEGVKSLVGMLKDTWRNPFAIPGEELCSLSTGASPPQDVVLDLYNAQHKGKLAYERFMKERFNENESGKLFEKIPRMKLKSFASVLSKKSVTVKGKEIMLKIDRHLFGKMAIIAQTRQLNMKDVLTHPLGPVPWALATSEGFLRKTNKASLANELEKLSLPTEVLPFSSASIIDAMSIVQKTKGCHKTFSDVSDAIFRKVLAEGSRSKRIDVVFDVYLDQSIKNAERAVKRGASSAISFKNIQAGHKIQQWDLFIKSSKNKTSLIQFLAKEWRQESYRKRLAGKTMFIGYDTECWKLTESTAQEATELRCAHEEADTRLLLHAKNAAEEGCEAVIIVSEDTDVFVLAVANRYGIQATMYQKRGTQARSRYVNITSTADALGYKVSRSLPGLHAFTGCDTVSAFASKGKLTALKIYQPIPLIG